MTRENSEQITLDNWEENQEEDFPGDPPILPEAGIAAPVADSKGESEVDNEGEEDDEEEMQASAPSSREIRKNEAKEAKESVSEEESEAEPVPEVPTRALLRRLTPLPDALINIVADYLLMTVARFKELCDEGRSDFSRVLFQQNSDFSGIDISGVDFSRAILQGAIFSSNNGSSFNLSSVSFRGAYLERAAFRGPASDELIIFIDTSFEEAHLSHVTFENCCLSGVNFNGADITRGSMNQCILCGNEQVGPASFSSTIVAQASFVNVTWQWQPEETGEEEGEEEEVTNYWGGKVELKRNTDRDAVFDDVSGRIASWRGEEQGQGRPPKLILSRDALEEELDEEGDEEQDEEQDEERSSPHDSPRSSGDGVGRVGSPGRAAEASQGSFQSHSGGGSLRKRKAMNQDPRQEQEFDVLAAASGLRRGMFSPAPVPRTASSSSQSSAGAEQAADMPVRDLIDGCRGLLIVLTESGILDAEEQATYLSRLDDWQTRCEHLNQLDVDQLRDMHNTLQQQAGVARSPH